uniref:Uncharacterized protein n=1 Tax=Anguilla anguilla TaxID=7936 RepID=A0A0E9W395_ANGAN
MIKTLNIVGSFVNFAFRFHATVCGLEIPEVSRITFVAFCYCCRSFASLSVSREHAICAWQENRPVIL